MSEKNKIDKQFEQDNNNSDIYRSCHVAILLPQFFNPFFFFKKKGKHQLVLYFFLWK